MPRPSLHYREKGFLLPLTPSAPTCHALIKAREATGSGNSDNPTPNLFHINSLLLSLMSLKHHENSVQ